MGLIELRRIDESRENTSTMSKNPNVMYLPNGNNILPHQICLQLQAPLHVYCPLTMMGFTKQTCLNNESLINGRSVALYRRNNGIQGQQEGNGDQFSVLEILVSVFRKSLVGCQSTVALSG
ncbi:Uncharacterized protein Fot_18771 [Forsythia ovata]|uniref:Uncharacterized protein n=1 Tax=Forsythia ovata TaxID=205694 RepID=A0ABD1VLX9_9LAMI